MDKVAVLDFGGPYNQLIARCVRELGVYSEILPGTVAVSRIQEAGYKAIILTGPSTDANTDTICDPALLKMGIPVLGICYGAQLLARTLGGTVAPAPQNKMGTTSLILSASCLFDGLESQTDCYMNYSNQITKAPADWTITAHTADCPIAAMENDTARLYAIQFHPEFKQTSQGNEILRRFLQLSCNLEGWNIPTLIAARVDTIRDQVGEGQVVCGLSGGVDSSVTAVLIHRAVGKRLTCIFVDHGLLRKNEADEVEQVFRQQFDMNLVRVDARARFLNQLAGVSDPEQKRKIIGETFIRVFEEEAQKLGQVDFLAQGTIYPDVIESGVGPGNSAVIKSHHNVGGLPKNIQFKALIEPLSDLFKDEVRQAGLGLGIPEGLIFRQPFPGPGLAVRVIGEITEPRLAILREADAIFREEIANAGLNRDIQQFFAILTDMRSVGVTGDERTYDHTVALRAVTTPDFMTADFAKIPYDVLAKVAARIVNEVAHVNRIVYDITTKPPATIEWE